MLCFFSYTWDSGTKKKRQWKLTTNDFDDKTLSFWLEVVIVEGFIGAAARAGVGAASFVSIHLRKKDCLLNENERIKNPPLLLFSITNDKSDKGSPLPKGARKKKEEYT